MGLFNVDGVLDAIMWEFTNSPFPIIAVVLAIAILWWLRADMKKQRKWREAKEDKMAKLERKIARKKAQALEEE